MIRLITNTYIALQHRLNLPSIATDFFWGQLMYRKNSRFIECFNDRHNFSLDFLTNNDSNTYDILRCFYDQSFSQSWFFTGICTSHGSTAACPNALLGTIWWFGTKTWCFYYLYMDTHLAYASIHAVGRIFHRSQFVEEKYWELCSQ